MNNLPPGAEHNPLAPWNQNSHLCKYCDSEEIQDELFKKLAVDKTLDEDRINEIVEEELDKYPLCAWCAKEEYFDYDED